ncbi:MAG: CHAT domain-containing protein, partial [Blastocatellia bacterium]|nr:CHAT domain-containing protein [Blastocatellia bacterium]
GSSRRSGPTSFSWIALAPGRYVIAAGASDGLPHEGHFEIRLEEKKPVAAEDEIRVDAERAAAEAQSSGEKNTPETRCIALVRYNEALALWREIRDRREEAMTLNDIGLLLINSGQYTQALESFAQAQPIWKSVADREGLAESFEYIADIQSDWGNLRLARENARQALELLQPSGQLRGMARAKTTLAVISMRMGEAQQALDLNREALQITRQIHDSAGEIMALNGLGQAYHEIGDDLNASDSAEQALQIAEKLGNPTFQMAAHNTLGEVYVRLGMTTRALNHALLGLKLSRRIGDQRMKAYSLNLLGAIHERRGEKMRALELYERSLTLNRKKRYGQEVAATLNNIGFIHESEGDRQKALSYYLEALPISREAENPAQQIRSLHNIARVLRDLGSLREALEKIEDAIQMIETLCEHIGNRQLRESYFASVQKSYELYIDVLMLLHKQQPAEALNEVALQISELARARSLREMLVEARAGLREGAPPRLLEHERALEHDLNSQAARRQILLSGAHSPEEVQQLARALRSLSLEYDEVERQIRESSPHYAALIQLQTVTSREIRRQLLDHDTALLEYALGEKRSYVWLVTPEKVFSHELPPRSVIEKAARRAHELLVMRQSLNLTEIGKFDERIRRVKRAEERFCVKSRELSRMILSPLAAELKQSRLLIVSDGALQHFPFETLPFTAVSRNAGQRGSRPETDLPLIEKYEVVNLPSASTLSELRKEIAARRPAPKTIAVIANPVFAADDSRFAFAGKRDERRAFTSHLRPAANLNGGEIPSLPFSEREGKEIIKLAPKNSSLLAMGFNANRSLLESHLLSQYRFIHFATHGLMNDENPELSGLLLSLYAPDGRKTENGFLWMHDIYKIKLQADLVVLSACQTGIGKEIKGEGLVGLTRGFMYAGASRVVASLWKVDDAATAALMGHFYHYLFQEKLSPSAALRQAQLRIMKQNRRWRSPYFWAAFVLQGEYR